MNTMLIFNALIVTKNSILENHALLIEGNRIKKIFPFTSLDPQTLSELEIDIETVQMIDAQSAWVTPGFIDIHSDNIESVSQPRPTSVIDFEIALIEQEKQLVNQGITTMYHSISFIGSDGQRFQNKEARKPERVEELLQILKKHQSRSSLLRHKFHCRYDMNNTEHVATLKGYIEDGFINLLSFTDHSPGQGQYRDLAKYRETLRKYRPGIEESQIDELIQEKMNLPKISSDDVTTLVQTASLHKVPIASHDDDSEKKLNFARSVLQSNISEFPVELSVARKAKELGMITVAGAPNVLLGRSHSGNVCATEAILDGCIDVLCSDYFPPSLLHAIFKLYREKNLPLWECVNLVTLNPARAIATDSDFGSIEEGKIADILCIKELYNKPCITKVLVNGKVVSELHY